jgi:recombination protein RecR
MYPTSDSLNDLIEEFAQLPGIGRKSAQRLAMYILKLPKEDVLKIAHALINVKEKMKYCSHCWNFSETDPCPICSSTRRDAATICVVEEPNDIIALERTNEYKGLYHVLGGSLSPLEGIGPDDLKVKELLARMKSSVQEIIIALSADIEGEATTIYLSRLLKPLGVKVTRLARGIPIGGDLEFADEATLVRALEARVPI